MISRLDKATNKKTNATDTARYVTLYLKVPEFGIDSIEIVTMNWMRNMYPKFVQVKLKF